MNLRKKTYSLLQPSKQKGVSYYIDLFIVILILLSVIDIILESEIAIREKFGSYFQAFEMFSVVIFTIEYFLRLWVCVEDPRYNGVSGRIKYMFSAIAVIDLMAILPFYLPFIGVDLRMLRALRLFRIFRLFKMARYTSAFDLIRKVIRSKREELVITMIFILISLVVISTLMYYFEREAQPDKFSSITKSLWWGVVTLTTVGYGDVYPITIGGKILNGIVTLLGIGLIALPSGILASGYTEEVIRRKAEKNDMSK